MNCSKKYKNKTKKYWKENTIHPLSIKRVNNKFIDVFRKEVLYCGGCKTPFPLQSNQLKIHCNSCNQFFHCNIAGECYGKDCKIIKDNGEIHRASYCIHCVGCIFDFNSCFCKDCYELN